MKRPDGVTIIAIAQFVMGALALLGACAIVAGMFTVMMARGEAGGRVAAIMFMGIGLLATLLSGVLPLLAGWGLLHLKAWARWLTIVLAIFMLFGFPVGTAIGAVIIWYLLQPHIVLAFGPGLPVMPQSLGPVSPPIPTVPPSPASWSGQAASPPPPDYPAQGMPPASNER